MRNEAISLLLLVLLPIGSSTARAAKDIFEGMNATDVPPPPELHEVHEDPEALPIDEGEGLSTCVEDVIPENSINLEGLKGAWTKIEQVAKELPVTPPAMPELPQLWAQIGDILKMPKFSLMGEEIKTIVAQYRQVVDAYGLQWRGFFAKRQQEFTAQTKGILERENNKITSFFSRHFQEFDGVCLPDENACLQSIQKNLEEYNARVNKNVAACKAYAERQLEQHDKWAENERKHLERPFLRVEQCFDRTQFSGSFMSCVGNVMGNFIKLLSDGMKKFSETMEAASSGLSNRLGRFQECVVNRKKLLDKAQSKIAAKGASCLRKQPQTHPEIFAR